jgi:ribosomal protein S6--L-glutamate ligase
VIGGKVVAAFKRQSEQGEFRSNLHRGGTGEAVKLTESEEKAAIQAAKALGVRVAGVDMIQSDRGPMIMEVNSSPGLEGVEKYTGVNIADLIVGYIEDKSNTDESDNVGV